MENKKEQLKFLNALLDDHIKMRLDGEVKWRGLQAMSLRSGLDEVNNKKSLRELGDMNANLDIKISKIRSIIYEISNDKFTI